jgi:IclR family acetate operon transcriptional repressor
MHRADDSLDKMDVIADDGQSQLPSFVCAEQTTTGVVRMPARIPSKKRERAGRRPQQAGSTARLHPVSNEEFVAENGEDDRYFSRAVAKSLRVLEVLQSTGSAMSLHEIAGWIQLSKPSTFRLLRTLDASGCLVSIGAGKYQIAPELHSVVPALWLARLLRVAAVHMQEVNRSLLETVSMAALFDNRIEVVAVIDSPHIIRMSNVVGHILPPNASALGKVITAHQNEERREKLLRSYRLWQFTEHTITDRSKLEEEFRRVKADKFATDREESVPGGICFAVPVFNIAGDVNVALSASLPKMRIHDAGHEKRILAALRTTSENISAEFLASQGAAFVNKSRGRR